MTTCIRILAITVLSLVLASCNIGKNQIRGNGNVTEKTIAINGNFTALKASSGWEVFLKKGSQPSVSASIDENLYEFLDVHLDGNTLKIDMLDDYDVSNASSRRIYVTYTETLEELKANSAADIIVEGTLEGEKMIFDVSSAGNITANVEVRNIEAEATSAADLKISGLAETFTGDARSAATIDAQDLRTETAHCDVSSAGEIAVFVSKTLHAEASSGGDINYWGAPKEVHDSESSGGSIRKRS